MYTYFHSQNGATQLFTWTVHLPGRPLARFRAGGDFPQKGGTRDRHLWYQSQPDTPNLVGSTMISLAYAYSISLHTNMAAL